MSKTQWDGYFSVLASGLDLEPSDVQWCMREILEGRAETDLIKIFLLALKNKGETSEEVGALVAQMYEHCSPINIAERAVDSVGTGGDGSHSINISTTAAIVAAAAGAKVLKHGNRSASSRSGSADLLEALGVFISLDGVGVEKTFAELGIGFCLAPVFHPAMRYAATARKELGVSTVFNILGPLANPAKPQAVAVGVANDRMHLVMAQVLVARGVDGFVFRGDDGLDEITLATTTQILTLGNGEVSSDILDPLDFSIARAPISALVGGDAAENAKITRAIFSGEVGAPRDVVVLNAAAAIAAYDGKFDLNLHDRIADGVVKATAAIDSGAATSLLARWVELSNSLS